MHYNGDLCIGAERRSVYNSVFDHVLAVAINFGFVYVGILFQKKIILGNEEFVVRPVIGKTKKWRYSEVSLVEIYSNQGLSRPIALFAGQKRLVKIVSAYSGYFVLERIFEEKCGHVMNYCQFREKFNGIDIVCISFNQHILHTFFTNKYKKKKGAGTGDFGEAVAFIQHVGKCMHCRRF